MVWDSKIESAPVGELRALQGARLQTTVARVAATPFYRRAGLRAFDPAALTLADLQALPVTTRDDLRRYYPYGMLACSRRELVTVHASSGTTGKPKAIGYTGADLKSWSVAMARALAAAGVTRNDVIQNAYGYGLFTGGLGFHYGALEVGATVIPVSGGRTDLQLTIARDLGSTVLCCTPSFALHLASEAEAQGRSLKETALRVGIFGAEPWSEAMRQLIEEKTGLRAFDMYGLSEMTGPGVAFECEARDGLHVNEDLFFPEILNPVTAEPLSDGAVGELVMTSLNREALPLIRYRTGDLTALLQDPCRCGRTLRRIRRIIGRTDDMLIVAGVNFYPSQVESLLMTAKGVSGQYEIRLWTEETRDHIEVRLEAEPDLYADQNACDSLAQQIAARLRDHIGIRMAVKVVGAGTLERSQGKAKRVYDERGVRNS